MQEDASQGNQDNERDDGIKHSKKVRFDLQRGAVEQNTLLRETLSKPQALQEDTADQVKTIDNLTERTDRQLQNPGFLIKILSHPVTSILGITLFLAGIACLGANVGLALAIAMTVVGAVVAGASIVSKIGLFSNGSGARETCPPSNVIPLEMTHHY